MGFFFCRKKKDGGKEVSVEQQEEMQKQPTWAERFEQYQIEEQVRPDYTKLPEVRQEAGKTAYFADRPLSPEEITQDQDFREKIQDKDSNFQFLLRCEEQRSKKNADAIARNSRPFRSEDEKLWQSLPHVPHPRTGLPMPRMAIKTAAQAQATFWDFFKQFQFGLWGYRKRPYPPEKPNDIQQMLGYKWLDKRYYDFHMRGGGWYYKDRLGRTRGPMELVNLRTAWAGGIIDKNTFIWGDDMDEWAPISMVYGLEQCVNSLDMTLVTAGLDLIHKITRGISIWSPTKGHEKKSYKQLQQEALEKKKLEKAVMRLNDGAWPGERPPSHTLFLWAGGSELTTILEEHNKYMPDKFVSYNHRKRLAEVIPGLRPWQVLEVEEIFEKVTYGKGWYRLPLSSYTTRADYDEAWFKDYKDKWDNFIEDFREAFANVDSEQLLKKMRELEKKRKN